MRRGHPLSTGDRKIAVNLPQWLLMPAMLRQTDLLGVVSERFGNKLESQGIVRKPLPFESPAFEWRIYFHHRHAHSKACLDDAVDY